MNTRALAQAFPCDAWEPATQPPRTRHLRLVTDDQPHGPDEVWVKRLTQCLVEVLAGQRSAATLVRVLSPAVFSALRTCEADKRLTGGRVVSVRTQALTDQSVEVAAVVKCEQRTRAVALRLHRRSDRWRVVCLLVV